MAVSLWYLFEASLLCLNAICVLHEERFLAKVKWFKSSSPENFNTPPSMKTNVLNLFRSIRTVMKFIANLRVLIEGDKEEPLKANGHTAETDKMFTYQLVRAFNMERQDPLFVDENLIEKSRKLLDMKPVASEPLRWTELGDGVLSIIDVEPDAYKSSEFYDSIKFTQAFSFSKEVWENNRSSENQAEWGPFEQLIAPSTTRVGCSYNESDAVVHTICSFSEPRTWTPDAAWISAIASANMTVDTSYYSVTNNNGRLIDSQSKAEDDEKLVKLTNYIFYAGVLLALSAIILGIALMFLYILLHSRRNCKCKCSNNT